MNYLRILIFSLVIYGGYYLSNSITQLAFYEHLPMSFNLYGIHNVASGFAFCFIGIYAVILSVNNIKKLPIKIGNPNIVIVILIIISIVCTFVMRSQIFSKIEKLNYVECYELAKVATRFTRKTYAKNPQICEQLVKEKRE